MSILKSDFPAEVVALLESDAKRTGLSFAAVVRLAVAKCYQNDSETVALRYQNGSGSLPFPRAHAEESSNSKSTTPPPTQKKEKKQQNLKKGEGVRGRGMESHPPEVREVFDAWVGTIVAAGELAPAVIDKESAIAINCRLAEGLPVSALVDAVHGWQFDPWETRKSPTAHLIRALLKDRPTVEKFRKFKLDAHARAREPDEADRKLDEEIPLFRGMVRGRDYLTDEHD